jgi:uncharacterized protein YecE (DUF72 family)
MATEIFIGTQGWNYEGWDGSFYPRGVSSKETLSLYAKIFDTVEIDSTFYAIPSENTVRGWAARTPTGFRFSVKLPSEITHKNRLRNSQDHLLEFAARIRLLEDKLGCVLIQLPPDFHASEHQALAEFLKWLPTDLRFAIEFRDPNWITERTLAQLKECGVALTLTDGKWVHRELSFQAIADYPADFAYVRWMGRRELTDFSRIQIDRSKEMQQWVDAFQNLKAKIKLIYGYFNNHFQGHSPGSSNEFKRRLGLPVTTPDTLIIQPSLF